MPTLVAYVSGHGFGHASRTIEVLRALAAAAPSVRLVMRSQVAPWLVRRTGPPGLVLEPVEVDTGAIQVDSLSLDVAETVRRAEAFTAGLPERVAREAEVLRAHGADLVLADVPALGIAAARAAGVPGVMLGNFTWDWIYADYPGGAGVAGAIGRVYASADLALRLPLWGGFETCGRIVDLPFIARRSRRDAAEVRRAFGFPLHERLVLVSFGGFGVQDLDTDALARLDGYRVVLSGWPSTRTTDRVGAGILHLDEQVMYDRGYRYEDLVRAVDVVATKPGYGIISEAIANDAALLYTSRGHFAEYDVLVAGMSRHLRTGFVSQADLRAGRWQEPLDRLMAEPAPSVRPRVDGAEVASSLLLSMMGASGS